MPPPSKSYYESNRFSVWWRKGLASMVRELMPDGWEQMELLDVGVGDGYTIRLVKPEGKVTGVDFEPTAVALAKERGILAQDGSAYEIPCPEKSFSIVTCLEVLEHLREPEAAVKEFQRVVVPGGYLVLTTPIPNLRWRLIWWLWTVFGPGKKWKDIPHVTDLHVDSRPAAEGGVVAMLREHGLELVRAESCNYGMVAGILARRL